MTSDESKPIKVEAKSDFTSPSKTTEQNVASKEHEKEKPQAEEPQSEKSQSEKLESEKSKADEPQAKSSTAKRALESSSSESDNEEEEEEIRELNFNFELIQNAKNQIFVQVGKGLLEQPLEVEGKRQRRTIQRMDNSKLNESTSKVFEIPQGTGVKLGSIARSIKHSIVY